MNGWALFAHPLFLDQVETLANEAEALKGTILRAKLKEPPQAKAATNTLSLLAIPQDSGRT